MKPWVRAWREGQARSWLPAVLRRPNMVRRPRALRAVSRSTRAFFIFGDYGEIGELNTEKKPLTKGVTSCERRAISIAVSSAKASIGSNLMGKVPQLLHKIKIKVIYAEKKSAFNGFAIKQYEINFTYSKILI